MAYKTDTELKAQVDAVIKVNGNREITPPLHNAIETNIIDSKVSRGGNESIAGEKTFEEDLTLEGNIITDDSFQLDNHGGILDQAYLTMSSGNIVFGFDNTSLTLDENTANLTAPETITIFSQSDNILLAADDAVKIKTNGYYAGLKTTNLTADRNFEFPDSAGTLATQSYADALVTGLWDDRGNFSALGGAYPSSGGSGSGGAILKGDIWTISVAGTLPTSQAVNVGDTVRALQDTPGNTQGNWAIAEGNLGYTPVTNARTLNINGTTYDLSANRSWTVGDLIASNNLSDVASKPTSRANLGVDKRTTHGDSDYTILATDKEVVTSATLTAPRTFTLPAASAVNAGYEIIVADEFGGVTSTNTLIIARAGSDTINGATSETIQSAYGHRRLFSDGVSKWTFDAGIIRAGQKDASGGFAGLTLFKINFKNALNTFTSFFTNANTAARTYTFPDKDMTVAADGDSQPQKLLASNFTPSSGTNTTSEELLRALTVAASKVASGDLLQVYANLQVNNTAGNKTFRIYINNAATLDGNEKLIGTFVLTTSPSDSIYRDIPVLSDTTVRAYSGPTTNTRGTFAVGTAASTTVTVPSVSAVFYVLITGQKALGTDTDTVDWAYVKTNKA